MVFYFGNNVNIHVLHEKINSLIEGKYTCFLNEAP